MESAWTAWALFTISAVHLERLSLSTVTSQMFVRRTSARSTTTQSSPIRTPNTIATSFLPPWTIGVGLASNAKASVVHRQGMVLMQANSRLLTDALRLQLRRAHRAAKPER